MSVTAFNRRRRELAAAKAEEERRKAEEAGRERAEARGKTKGRKSDGAD